MADVEWRMLEFTPQEDITAYELALVVKNVGPMPVGPTYVGVQEVGVCDAHPLDPRLSRHFTPTGKTYHLPEDHFVRLIEEARR